jgi:hypothetical protein
MKGALLVNQHKEFEKERNVFDESELTQIMQESKKGKVNMFE